MSTDLYLFVEKRRLDTGAWELATDAPRKRDQNYCEFAVIGNVRNRTELFVPISLSRGLPEDSSAMLGVIADNEYSEEREDLVGATAQRLLCQVRRRLHRRAQPFLANSCGITGVQLEPADDPERHGWPEAVRGVLGYRLSERAQRRSFRQLRSLRVEHRDGAVCARRAAGRARSALRHAQPVVPVHRDQLVRVVQRSLP